jgi:hypothetical protein
MVIPAERKRKRGRPPTGQRPIIGVRVAPTVAARLEKWAKARGYTRSEAIRVLIEREVGS